MVGIFGRGGKCFPSADPIPRHDTPDAVNHDHATRSSQVLPAKMSRNTNHVGNTTAGQSHIFSLPNWTRRIFSTSSHRNLVDIPVNEHGVLPSDLSSPRVSRHRNKELPSDPPRDSGVPPHSSDHFKTPVFLNHSSQDSAHRPHTRPSTATQTARHRLNVHLDPRPATIVEPPMSYVAPRPPSCLRPSKSSQSLHSVDRTKESLKGRDASRSRLVSIAVVSANAKKDKALLGVECGHPPSSFLTRRPSVWSRKAADPAKRSSVLLTPPSSLASQSASPIQVDLQPPASTSLDGHGSLRLKRRHSERAIRHTSANQKDVPAVPCHLSPQPKSALRPSTADSFLNSPPSLKRRPGTADSSIRSRAKSLFSLSSQASSTSKSLTTINSDKPVLQPAPAGSSEVRSHPVTRPPLLHRISVGLFAPSPSPVVKTGGFLGNGASSPTHKSPRPSVSQVAAEALKPQVGESPEAFVQRLVSLVSRADIAGILASSGENIYAESLRSFVDRFSFSGDPLDIALRRLLMDTHLPKETQQIDRVIEAFAKRYMSCNSDLFSSPDHPYILAFSLIMLHTDAFNKSNRRKMTKTDYLKNTLLPGLIPEVLDCFYDNIVFAPFIFIEDPLDMGGNLSTSAEGGHTRPPTPSVLPSPLTTTGILNRPKIDPYYLIMNNLLDQLRVNVQGYIPVENPYKWDGTGASWDYDEILQAFANGQLVVISCADNARSASAFFGFSVGGFPTPSASGSGGGVLDSNTAPPEARSLKVTKLALLSRRDDLLEGGKKAIQRKWRPYSVALTQSHLLFSRDLSWATSGNSTPKATVFKADETVPIKDAIAVLDRSYAAHTNTFRLIVANRRHILLQATDEKEMNEWISRINYASAFESTEISLRPPEMSGADVELTGVAAAASHVWASQSADLIRPRVSALEQADSSNEPHTSMGAEGSSNSGGWHDDSDLQRDFPVTHEIRGRLHFKETFAAVKAELAVTHTSVSSSVRDFNGYLTGVEMPAVSAEKEQPTPSRAQMIHSRVHELEAQICAMNSEIDSHLRFSRNIAVLVPFQRSTRGRLQEAVRNMAKRVQASRVDVTKLTCYRNILLDDLEAETRGFKRATSLALQTATETLNHHVFEVVSTRSLSTLDLRAEQSPPEGVAWSASRSSGSLTGASFRTALSFGPDWPSSGEAFVTSTLRETARITDSSLEAYERSAGFPSPNEQSRFSESVRNPSAQDTSTPDKSGGALDPPEEQAEEWNKTRAAKRVSLVRLPSDLRLSAIIGKSSQYLNLGPNSIVVEEPPVVSRSSS